MSIREKIFAVLEDYNNRHTIWREEEVNGELEYCEIDDDIINIFNEENIKDVHIEHTGMLDNTSITIYSVSVAWIENGKLCSILNYQIDDM